MADVLSKIISIVAGESVGKCNTGVGLFSTCHHRDVSSLKWNLYRPIGAGDHRFPLEASQAECDD